MDIVRYQVSKTNSGPAYHEWTGVEFVGRVAAPDPVRCGKCGGEMKLVALILDDKELDRILAHQGWPVTFPKTKASRAPPVQGEARGEGVPRLGAAKKRR